MHLLALKLYFFLALFWKYCLCFLWFHLFCAKLCSFWIAANYDASASGKILHSRSRGKPSGWLVRKDLSSATRVKRSMLICNFLRVVQNLKSDAVVAVAVRHHCNADSPRTPPTPAFKNTQQCGLLICCSLHLLFLPSSSSLFPPRPLSINDTISARAFPRNITPPPAIILPICSNMQLILSSTCVSPPPFPLCLPLPPSPPPSPRSPSASPCLAAVMPLWSSSHPAVTNAPPQPPIHGSPALRDVCSLKESSNQADPPPRVSSYPKCRKDG